MKTKDEEINTQDDAVATLEHCVQGNNALGKCQELSPADKVSKERIARYVEQREKTNAEIKWIEEKRENGFAFLKAEQNNNFSLSAYHATLLAMTGSTQSDYAHRVLNKTTPSLFPDKDREGDGVAVANALEGALLEMAPKDITDGIFCRRIIALDMHIAQNLALAAASNQRVDFLDRYVNNAAKLSRILNETIEARTRYLRQGEQKVTVTHQHVNVNQGGQAVVAGELNTGGGVNGKK